jgi:hypothetical protein
MNLVTAAGPLDLVNATGGGAACSPITEIKNGAVDRIFVSVGNNDALGTGCGGNGCLYSFDISGAFPTNATAAFPTPLAAAGGTSGIVVDNVSAGTQASSIYFTFNANSDTSNNTGCNGVTAVGCVVKLTQNGLN